MKEETIADALERFVAGFNDDNLNEVMTFFAADAVYLPGDGREHHGLAAIREALRPQFTYAFGATRFIVNDRIIDERARKATIRWVCQHDVRQVRPFYMRCLYLALFGKSAGWYGTDIFHFDEHGQITRKFSYANYGRHPHVRRDLGANR